MAGGGDGGQRRKARPPPMAEGIIKQKQAYDAVQTLGVGSQCNDAVVEEAKANLPMRLKGGDTSPLRLSLSPRGLYSPTIDPDSDVMLVVRNSFLEAKPIPTTLRKCRSDSELSCCSDDIPYVPRDEADYGEVEYDPELDRQERERQARVEERQRAKEEERQLRIRLGNPGGAPQHIGSSLSSTATSGGYNNVMGAQASPAKIELPSAAGVQASPAKIELAPSAAPLAPDLPPGELPSAGSVGHADGSCHPCCFFRRDKCTAGKDCTHCHFPHVQVKHPGKKSRERQKVRAQKEAEAAAGGTVAGPGVA